MVKKTSSLVYNTVFILSCLFAGPAMASVGLYVGSDLTEDGSVLLGGYGDEPSSHWIEVVPGVKHEPGATLCVGITEDARFPGVRFGIPQSSETFKYIAVKYSSYAGYPAPLENGGLNEHNVAARDIWSPSRSELVDMTPDPQKGLSYSDLSRIAMERASSAREAAEIVGRLVDEHGYATYGGNSHLFADVTEGWVLIEFAGGQGLWVAERLGSDEVRVSRPGYIGEIPDNYQEHPDFMGSDNLISFAVERGWYDPDRDGPFNVNRVYGTDRQPEVPGIQMRDDIVEKMEEWLSQKAPVSLEDMKEAVRSTIITGQTAGYGTVAHLRDDVPAELRTLWATVSPALTSPFVPYYIGMEDVPVEFKWGRYLSVDESDGFLPQQLQVQEATRYAYHTFKRLFYAVDAPREAAGTEWPDEEAFSERFNMFYPEVHRTLNAFEQMMREDQKEKVEKTAGTLLQAGERELANAYLTDYSNTHSLRALEIVSTLTRSIELRSSLLFERPEYSADEIYRDLR
ncbi:MAG: C69 family dipeptidase [Balneolaceae bacterium]